MNYFQSFEKLIIESADSLWNGPILIFILLGGGVIIFFYSRLLPFKYIFHSLDIIKEKHSKSTVGKITHFQAITTQIGTIVGLGNISGVAIAIVTGGPGAIFWMWVTALFGMITKFYTCSLAVMYRGVDSEGNYQGGPMYVIKEGLGKKWNFLGIIFCFFGLFGVSPIFQANQIVKVFNSVIFNHSGSSSYLNNFVLGVFLSILVSLVIFGGIKRIGKVASKLVPFMVIIYMVTVFYIILLNYNLFFSTINLIITDAFSANSVLGGAVGSLILIGARRAAFSNEAGVGTSPIIHAASKTDNPIKEGLVAMIGPFVDTIIVCTLTAFCILVTGVWKVENSSGIELVIMSFDTSIPVIGKYILFACTLVFALTTLFGNSYFGERCLSYLVGETYSHYYRIFYIILILIGSVSTLNFVVSLIDLSYGIMIFPTMISTLLLAPKINKLSKEYFEKLKL